ncbi:MAG: ABC transporter permease [Acidimicrobiales bacterium]
MLLGVGVAVLAAAAGPWLAPFEPSAVDVENTFAPSTWAHPLGTDQIGRDVASRIIAGARWSVGGALLVTAVVCTIGVTLGALAGLRGGWVDAGLMRVVDGLLALPSLLLALAVVAVINALVAGPGGPTPGGYGLAGVLLALCSFGWAGYARIVRGQVLSLRQRDYILAARAAGAGNRQVLIRHVVPQLTAPVLVLATLEVGQLILALAGLSFLGLGARSPTPEWGLMINEARNQLFRAPRLMVYPGVAISLTVLAFNLLGDRLRDFTDPRLRGSSGWARSAESDT